MRGFDQLEMEDLINLKDETNREIEIDLDKEEIRAAHDILRKNISYYLTSNIVFHPFKTPQSCYISLRISHVNDNIIETLQKILDCVQAPFRIFIDFFALSKSATRPDFQLIHPSVATCFNETTMISNLQDEETLIKEFSRGDFNERVLQKHHLVRRFAMIFQMP